MDGKELLAWNVRRLRVEQGLSQERLAADASVDRAYLGGMERMQINPTLEVIERVANVLNVELAELFRRPRRGARPPAPLAPGRRAK